MAMLFAFFILVWIWLYGFSLCCAVLDGLKAARASDSRSTPASPWWFFRVLFWRRVRPYAIAFTIILLLYLTSIYAIMFTAGWGHKVSVVQSLQIGSFLIGLSILFASVCAIVAPRCCRPAALLLVSLTGTFLIFHIEQAVFAFHSNNFLSDAFYFISESEIDPAPISVGFDVPVYRYFGVGSNLHEGPHYTGSYDSYGYSVMPFTWALIIPANCFWFLIIDIILGVGTWLWIRGSGIHWFRMEY